ncbi:DUF6090 family protein [uncultured Croceitalea sp.]|uniref:DUF6090 family protein n=1 Tax=uncultured Croceitalea sp. TaxID=1798908 RepID=UPI0033061C95
MIKFFRKIRQNLLSENKFSKYLIYAVGEIILVVIGILIALQINNWNENRKSEIETQNYYRQILIEIKNERKYIDSQINRLERSITTYDNYVEFVKNPKLKPIEVIQALEKVDLSFGFFSFFNETLETLESTGDLKLIPKNIRNKLIEIQHLKEWLVKQQSVNDKTYGEALIKPIQLGYFRLLKHPEPHQGIDVQKNMEDIIISLEAAFVAKNFTEKDKINSLNQLRELNTKLEDLITLEIEK